MTSIKPGQAGNGLIKQISVNLENIPGQLSTINDMLAIEGVNIRALSVIDNPDMSMLRMVTDDPVRTLTVLKSRGIVAQEKEVIAAELPEHPGGLKAILKQLSSEGINIYCLYSFLGRMDMTHPILIIEVDRLDEAVEVLHRNWVNTLGQEIYSL